MTGQSSLSEDEAPKTPLSAEEDAQSSPLPRQDTKNHDSSSVQVAVRVRPLLPHEAGTTNCVSVLRSSANIPHNVIRLGGSEGPKFTFDQVFDLDSSQTQVFEERVSMLIENLLEGYNATCLAYGQTGSGKTHTIMGPSMSTGVVQDEYHQGIIPRAIRDVFERLEALKKARNPATVSKDDDAPLDFDFTVKVQFLEVYGEEIRDLLNPSSHNNKTKLSIRDVGMDEPEVLGATQHPVSTAEEALLCLTRGMFRRVTGATAMNETSSRSHAILSLLLEQSTVVCEDGSASPVKQSLNDSATSMLQHVQGKRSKFNFVDLAGSERQKRTKASGQRLKEGIDINKGLLVLGNVISALGDPQKVGKTFVPYRDSKLTRLLKGSLGGNHKTLMIACVSPASTNMEETLNCLRYANRAKNIQNHAVVNVDATTRLVQELKGQVRALAKELIHVREGGDAHADFSMETLRALVKGADVNLGDSSFSISTPGSSFVSRARFDGHELQGAALSSLRAEKEMYRIQAEVMNDKAHSADFKENISDLQQAFQRRVTHYEQEIAELRGSIQTPRTQAIQGYHYADTPPRSNTSESFASLPPLSQRSPSRQDIHLDYSRSESPDLTRLRTQIFGSMSHDEQVDAEITAVEEATTALTRKYIPPEDDEEDEAKIDKHIDEVVGDFQGDVLQRVSSHQQLELDLFQLSSSISAKEELIQQLQSSQEKYELMRDFYETKLKEMEDLLHQKEMESEKLITDLRKLDGGHASTKELEAQLTQKKAQIAALRKKQQELTRLTAVASKNESQIARLRHDVVDMKQKKVQLQKQISEERKLHASEIQKLKKENYQKDRQLNRVRKESDRNAQEAKRAQHIAKTRLEQASLLKAKYKETEKKLRLQTVKRGVMAKAGLNPVLVGRKTKAPTIRSADTPPLNTARFDMIRDYFDAKVADVGRREALAEKLAHEWEDHLDLSTRRDELIQSKDADNEEVEAVHAQIRAKEDRIRQLASKLGKRREDETDVVSEDRILFDDKFQALVGAEPDIDASGKTAAKVLFGMVVRERRRVAAIARVASALDERVQEAEQSVRSKDAAFKSYVDEQSAEMASLAQNHQEQILSLMNMVREDSIKGGGADAQGLLDIDHIAAARRASTSGIPSNPRLLVLANERIAALERQVSELDSLRAAAVKAATKYKALESELSAKTDECDALHNEVRALRATLKQVRDELGGRAEPDNVAALPSRTSSKSPGDIFLGDWEGVAPSRASKLASSMTEYDDHSESEEMPDWADDIMADLAVIAEGGIPDALIGSPGVQHLDEQLEKATVFDRLSNPKSFTGIQKKLRQTTGGKKQSGLDHRRAISKQVTESLEKISVPGEDSTPTSSGPVSSSSSAVPDGKGNGRSVFDRLLSPSNLTGTQKSRFKDKRSRSTHDSDSSMTSEISPESQLTARTTRLSKGHAAPGDGGDESSHGDATKPTGTDIGDNQAKKHQRRDLAEYTKQDVFERLTRTTTQAYAPKQHKNIAEEMLENILDDEHVVAAGSADGDTKKDSHHPPEFSRVDEYAKRNVFERLTQTTTQAYATKTHRNIAEGMLDEILVGDQVERDATEESKDVVSDRLKNATNQQSGERKLQHRTSADELLDDILDDSDGTIESL